MRMLPLVIFLAILQFSIMLYTGTLIVGPNASLSNQTVISTNASVIIASQTSGVIATGGSNSIFDFIFDPTQWNGSSIVTILLTLLTLFTGASLLAAFIFRTDVMIFAPWFYATILFGSIPLVNLFNLVNQERGFFGAQCVATLGLCAPMVIIDFFIGLIGIAWIFTCIQNWRQGS